MKDTCLITIISVSHNSIECSWTPPSDLGGSPIANYIVTANQISVVTSSTKTTLSPLSMATEYAITVV